MVSPVHGYVQHTASIYTLPYMRETVTPTYANSGGYLGKCSKYNFLASSSFCPVNMFTMGFTFRGEPPNINSHASSCTESHSARCIGSGGEGVVARE